MGAEKLILILLSVAAFAAATVDVAPKVVAPEIVASKDDTPDDKAPLADNRCLPYDPRVITTVPHEYNCSLYYECYQGVSSLMSCGDLYFNPNTSSCDFPAVSGCTNRDPVCQGVQLDYLPYFGDCTRYIECYRGDSYVMSCPDGFYFDSRAKMCVDPAESDCETYPWTTPNPVCWGVSPGEIKLMPFPGDCHNYWQCNGADLTLHSCPGTFLFDEERQMCDFADNVDCSDNTGTPPTTEEPPSTTYIPTTPDENDPRCIDNNTSYWPHPVLCTRYIECYNGVGYEMNCPNGLYYSDNRKECVIPSQSECGRTEPPTRPTVTWPTDWTADPDCPYPSAEGRLFPYPGDCTKFYECAEGVKVAMDCPSDLWFSPYSLRCEYPYYSNCPWGRSSFLDMISYYIFKK